MTLFIETLIQEGIITSEQALTALLSQIERAPSIAHVVSDLKLLSASDLTRVLLEQARGEWAFQAAAQKIGVWTETLAEAISLELVKRTLPITQILIEQGALSATRLNESFDRNQVIPAELPQDFSTELLEPMRTRAQALSGQPSKTQLEEIFHDFHHLKGIAVFKNLKPLEAMTIKFEAFISILTQNPEHEYQSRAMNLILAGIHVIPLLFEQPLSEMTQAKVSRLDAVLERLLENHRKTG